MAKKNEITKSKPTLDIDRFVKRDKLKEWKKLSVGALYYEDHFDKFVLVQKVHESKKYERYYWEIDCLETRDGVTWKERKHRLSDVENYYTRIYLEEGETPEAAIRSLREELKEKLLAQFDENYNEDEDEEDEDEDDEDDEDEVDTETKDLVVKGGSEVYEREAFALIRTKERIKALSEMAKRKADLIYNEISAIEKRLRKVMRVLGILETYLGTHEEIFQITQGQPAPISEPIHIRQMILFMDEEAAIVNIYNTRRGTEYEGNINYQNVELFDEWLLKDNNLDVVLPEIRGVVALRPSRNRDQYENEDKWTEVQKLAADRMVYLLIRNGENLYRLWTSLSMSETFFATNATAEKIADMIENARFDSDKEKAEDEQAEWLRNTLLMQGIVDRTDLFQPMPLGRTEFANPETYEEGGRVRLIRDAENTITDGHVSFEKWRDELNSKVQRGTRIYFRGAKRSYRRDETHHDRFWVYNDRDNYPDFPNVGVFTVEEVCPEKYSKHPSFRILYMPTEPVWSRRGRYSDDLRPDDPRRKRYSFRVYFDECVNYDDFTVEDIDYFLKSRLDRPNYYYMMPLLISLRAIRIEELEKEKAFARLVSEKEGISEKKVFELIDWWKKKVINKRPLNSDDAKAWRMIIRKAKGLI